MIHYNKNNRGFVSLIGLLLVAAIIAVVFYIMMKSYVNPPVSVKEKEMFEQSGIDTSSYKGILDTTKKKIHDLNKQTQRRQEGY